MIRIRHTAVSLALAALLLAGPVSPVFAQAKAAAPATAEATASAPAPDAIAGPIRERIKAWTGGRFDAEEVRTTPMPGLFEVRIRTDLFYVDQTARFIIVEGELVDMTNSRNYTRERMEQVMAIKFDDLPIAKAVKQVIGDGKRVVALFEDPNCGYCKRLRADLMALDNLTIYTFAYPILAADSDLKSRKALCAADVPKAWANLMLTGQVPDNDGSCKTDIAEFKALGERYGINATPTLFFPSGYRMQGYAPPTRFVELLDANQNKPSS